MVRRISAPDGERHDITRGFGRTRARRRRTRKGFDKAKLPSRHVTEGPERAPHRAFLYAMGLTDEEVHQPLIGVATCWNEAAPCNISLSRQAQAAKRGVSDAGGTPEGVHDDHRHRRDRDGP